VQRAWAYLHGRQRRYVVAAVYLLADMFDHPEARLGDDRDRLEELRPWLDLEDGMKISVHIAVGAGDDTPTVLGEAGQSVAELRCATPLTFNVDVMLPMSHPTLRLANGIRQALRRLEFL